jgi:uncharacterized protein YbjT (DUF2867 family)
VILVFGSTGNVGRELVAKLAAAGEPVRAVTRAPETLRERLGIDASAAVEAVGGDFDDPATLSVALDGVDRVFMAAPAGPLSSTQDANVAAAVRAAKVRHVVKLSSLDVLPPADNLYARLLAAGERSFRKTGVRCTVLRPTAFMSNAFQWLPTVRSERTVYGMYGHIARALIDPADIAAVAATVLASEDGESETHVLTGPQALTMPEQVAVLSTVLGEEVRYVDAPPAVVGDAMRSAGMDGEFVDGMLTALGNADPERGGRPVPTVERLTGRPAGTFAAWLTANAARFR